MKPFNLKYAITIVRHAQSQLNQAMECVQEQMAADGFGDPMDAHAKAHLMTVIPASSVYNALEQVIDRLGDIDLEIKFVETDATCQTQSEQS